MISNYFKVFFILFLFIFSNEVKSKTNENIEFRVSELSNYFSAVVAYGNQENEQSLKYFKSSRNLLNKHDEYLRQYIFSLVLNQNVTRAIQEIKFSENKKNSNFFESYLLLFLDSIKKKDYEKSNLYLNEISSYKEQGTFEQIIYETLKNYLFTFEKKKISPKKSNFGNLTLINEYLEKHSNYYLNWCSRSARTSEKPERRSYLHKCIWFPQVLIVNSLIQRIVPVGGMLGKGLLKSFVLPPTPKVLS